LIYAAVARLAAENGTPGQLETLKSIQLAFRRNSEGGEAADMAMHNHHFHKLIGEMAGNPYLEPSVNRLLIDHTRMSQKFYRPNNSSERERIWLACDQHDQMIEAFEKREAATAVQLTLDHWALSRDEIEKFVRPDPLPLDLDMGHAPEGRQHAV
jgi:DNA-binding GntR family transcriptional regulator